MFSTNDLYSVLLLLTTLLTVLYFYLSRDFNYWKCRGINGTQPIILVGTLWKLLFKSLPNMYYENYLRYGKIYGQFIGGRPVLVIVDPQLVRDMTIKNFHKFSHKIVFQSGEPLIDRRLPNLKGDEWKTMRSIISSNLSSGKMRKIHPMITDCVKRLGDYLMERGLNEIELQEVMAKMVLDVIASCAFGTYIDVYNDSKSNEFLTNSRNVFRRNWRYWTTVLMVPMFPKLFKTIGFEAIEPNVKYFFKSAIQTIRSNRMSMNVKPNDYLQAMIDAENNSLEEREVNADTVHEDNENKFLRNTKPRKQITEDDFMANSMTYFATSYETSTLVSHLFYLLAMNGKCQQKLYEEVIKFNGDYSYETIAQMPYLEACVEETLRLYGSLSHIRRIAVEEYTIGDTGITIPKGMLIYFDIHSIHHSPEYYTEPLKWDPERFMPENRDQLTPYTYLPFGSGPRNCVGMRLALIIAKTSIAYMVYRFRFFKTSNTPLHLKTKKFETFLKTTNKYVGIECRHTLK